MAAAAAGECFGRLEQAREAVSGLSSRQLCNDPSMPLHAKGAVVRLPLGKGVGQAVGVEQDAARGGQYTEFDA